jgi:hypothetical protein
VSDWLAVMIYYEREATYYKEEELIDQQEEAS